MKYLRNSIIIYFLILILILNFPLNSYIFQSHSDIEGNSINSTPNSDTRAVRDTWIDDFTMSTRIETMENVKWDTNEISLSEKQYIISSTEDFDNGTFQNIETYSNNIEIPENEFKLTTDDIFSEDFETTEGTNWIGYNNWLIHWENGTYEAKIKSDQSYSGSKSGRLFVQKLSGHVRDNIHLKHSVTSVTDEKIVYHLYVSKTKANPAQNLFHSICSTGKIFAKIIFDKDHYINYWDGNSKDYTSLSYKENQWYKVTVQHNFNDNTYSAWLSGDMYNNQLIINKAQRKESGGNTIEYIGLEIYTSWDAVGGYNWWDDIKVFSGYHQTGSWQSAPIELENKYSLIDTTIEFADVETDKSEIDKIEWLENDVVKAAYDTDIDNLANSPFTITEAELTSGSFEELKNNFTIKVYLKGDGEHSPTVKSLTGNLRALTGHITSTPIELNQNYCWEKALVSKTITTETEIKVSVLDGITGDYLTGFENSTDTFINLSTLDSKTYPVIKLRADLFGSSAFSPILQQWSVSWVDDYPVLDPVIPSNYTLPEDTNATHLINLRDYFSDYYDTPEKLTYKVTHQSNKKHLEAKIDSYYLNFHTKLKDWNGIETFKVECTDTGGLKTQSNIFEVTVTPVNDPPYWDKNIPDLKLDEDTTKENWLDLDDYSADIEEDYLDFKIVYQSDSENISININADNKLTIIPSRDYYGTSSIIVQVFESDDIELYSNDTFNIKVLPMNDPPTFSPTISDQIIDEDQWLNFTLSAYDPDLDVNLTFRSNISKPNFDLDSSSGKLSFHPTNDDVGVLFVNVSVEDEGSLRGYDNFKITIRNVNDPPEDPVILSPKDGAGFKINKPIDFLADNCYDIDFGDVINYSWDFDFTDGIQRDKVGRMVNNTYEVPGKYKITLSITDGTVKKSTFIILNITKPTTPEIIDQGDDKKSETDNNLLLIVIVIIVIIVCILIILSLYFRSKKRSLLSKYLNEIDQAYDWARTNPTVGKEKLSNLKLKLSDDLKNGTLPKEDYVLLENKLNEYMRLLGVTVAKPPITQMPMATPLDSPTQPAQTQPQVITTTTTPHAQKITPIQPEQSSKPTESKAQTNKKIVQCFNCGNYVTVTLAPEGEPTLLDCPKCGQKGTV